MVTLGVICGGDGCLVGGVIGLWGLAGFGAFAFVFGS